ncbi:MAG: 4Fe-4S binding protein [Desulfobacteraceae bacterium]|nr:4Fe-4S binding protein [Desulfobacteraceae bacterium]
MYEKQMLICDRNICTGCRLCEMACSAVKVHVFDPRFSRIRVQESPEGVCKAYTCVSCEGDPACVQSCPRHALTRDPETLTIRVDAEKCDLCGRCIVACPYGVIVLHPETSSVAVCDFCADQEEPVCVRFCPTGALSFSQVLPIHRKKAKRQINISLGCNNCGQCVPTCSSEILQVINGWLRPTDPSKCQVCEHCATNCPIGAIRINRRSKILF